MQKPKD